MQPSLWIEYCLEILDYLDKIYVQDPEVFISKYLLIRHMPDYSRHKHKLCPS